MNILLDCNANVGKEVAFKSTMWNDSLHQDSNDNGVRMANFAISKYLAIMSTMLPHENVHKYNWASHDEKAHNHIDHILVDR
jgi:hypothetical protein